MESFENERRVQQGEDWNLDILLSSSDREYIPFIVSSQRTNPFFVCTVASTKYEKNLRYVKSWWNSVESQDIPTFYQTVPQYYGEVASIASLPTVPSTNSSNPTFGDSAETRLLYQYTLSTDKIDPDLGHKPYYYFYFEYDEDGTLLQRVDSYECRIRFNFLSSDTAEWGGQNYMYQITLVSGELLEDKLNDIYLAHGEPENWPDTTEAQYNYVKVNWPNELQPDIDYDSPLGYIEHPEPILTPTKLEVFNNLRILI